MAKPPVVTPKHIIPGRQFDPLVPPIVDKNQTQKLNDNLTSIQSIASSNSFGNLTVGSLTVTGDAVVSGNFTTYGSGTFQTNLMVSGWIQVAGSGFVAGPVVIGGSGTIKSDLITSGNFWTAGTGYFQKAVDARNSVSIRTNLGVSGDTTLIGNETVSGNFSTAGTLYAQKAFEARNSVSVRTNLGVSGDTTFVGGVSVSGYTTVSGLTTLGNIITSGNISVAGSGLIAGFVDIGGNASINGKLAVGLGFLTVPSGVIHIGPGDATTPQILLNPSSQLTVALSGALSYTGRSLTFCPGDQLLNVVLSSPAITGSTVIANTTATTTGFTAIITPGIAVPTRVYVVRVLGRYSTANGADTFTARARMANTNIISVVSDAGNVTNGALDIEFVITCRSVGVAGTFWAFVQGEFNQVNKSTPGTSAVTVDTTTQQPIFIDFTWSNALAGNTISIDQGFMTTIG